MSRVTPALSNLILGSIVFIMLSGVTFLGFAQGVAALTVNPIGEQQMDISTGITTLSEGGEVIDNERELKLTATFISYKDKEFIEARGVTSEGPFGLLQAPELRLEVASNTITATGGISLTKDGLALTADSLTLELGSSIAVLSGNVKNTEPAFETAAIVLKQGGGYAILASPFKYQNGPIQFNQDTPGSFLQLKQVKNEDGTFKYSVSTTLDEAISTELTPYLP
jgi:hypothetical protein